MNMSAPNPSQGACARSAAESNGGPRWAFGRNGRWAFALIIVGCGLGWAQSQETRPLAVAPEGRPGFTLLAPQQTGICFTNSVPQSRHLTNQILLNGSGVALSDVDGDGQCDVFLGALSGAALFRNLGDWHFTNITAGAFAAPLPPDITGCAFADFDGDGAPDLGLNTLGRGTHVLFNNGHGLFAARFAPLNLARGGTSLAIADVDGDGFLDLYVCNYRTDALMDKPNARATLRRIHDQVLVETVDGRRTTEPDLTNRYVVTASGVVEEQGEADVLFRNLSGTNFTAVWWTSGAFLDEDGQPLKAPLFEWCLAAMFRDLNGDGRPELYVCNDFQSPDRLWLNASTPGHVRFRAARRTAIRHTSRFSMGLDFADVNRDGPDDLVVVDMVSRDPVKRLTQLEDVPAYLALLARDPLARPQVDATVLQLNRGDGTFAEVAAFAGIQACDWAWTPVFLDVDLDGWEDLLVANGEERDARDADVAGELRRFRANGHHSDAEFFRERRKYPRFASPKYAFRNLTGERGEVRFVETGAVWGFDTRAVAQGMAVADLDGDGDLDLVLNQLNGPALVYCNNTSVPRITVGLRGAGGNTRGIGAKIGVRGGPVQQSQEMVAGGRYLSGDDPRRTFAAGSASNLTVEVRWPAGRLSVVSNVSPNSFVEVDETKAVPMRPAQPVAADAQFQDISDMLGQVHRAVTSDELSRQVLLPRRLSTLGPGIGWLALDGDGNDALVVAGNPVGVFHWDGARFQNLTNLFASGDITMAVATGRSLLLAQSNYGGGGTNIAAVRRPAGSAAVPGTVEATGPIALADVDGDGNLDLFVGGRVIPGEWPQPATSRWFRSDGGCFRLAQTFDEVGMVSGAAFADLDGDTHPELALACEWGPLKLFRNEGGKLVAWDPPVTLGGARFTLSQLTGWWTGIAVGDFDGDGRADLLAGNWGENSYYELYRESAARGADAVPLVVFYGPLYDATSCQIVEGYGSCDDVRPQRSLGWLGAALPWLRAQHPTYRSLAEAKLPAMLGEHAAAAHRLEARWFSTTLLLNRGDCFDARRLPAEVQFSPTFGIAVADFDGDGNEDAFLAQNFFGQNFALTRDDASRGLLLRGDGHGGFQPVSASVSGIEIIGEGRGAAVADFDDDGRVDLAVAQQAGPTRVFRNRTAIPGLRIRLRGGVGNPAGIGASVRLRTANNAGPARTLCAGTGYWSTDSAMLVLARLPGASAVEVRWPNAAPKLSPLPPEVREVEIARDGTLKVIR